MHVSFLSTYPPRACGIATFTQDLRHATEQAKAVTVADVVAIIGTASDADELPPEVVYTIRQHEREDYEQLADFLNDSGTDVLSVQHEFGIFGGSEGLFLIDLLKRLRIPVATTLHTVLPDPPDHYRSALLEVASHSDLLVVMNEQARTILTETYGLDYERIEVAHHGVPTIEEGGQAEAKQAISATGRDVLLTFGLLGPSKGIEHALEALPAAVESCPDLLYVILGRTHPEIVKHAGESYRNTLKQRVRDLGLDEHVRFDDIYADHAALCEYLRAADVYLSPYPGMDQISSGTLAYAVGAGKAIVSTPYLYAKEALGEGRGLIASATDPEDFGEAICRLLSDEDFRKETSARAHVLGKEMRWPAVGERYATLFGRLRSVRRETSLEALLAGQSTECFRPRLTHLAALTDDTGLFQHAVHSIPDRHHGYCTDDNGRAIVATLQYAQRYPGEAERAAAMMRTYLGFVHYAFTPTGRFRNFLDYERRFMDAQGTEDTQGRARWGLGAVVAWSGDGHARALARDLFLRSLRADLTHPRALAYALCGSALYLRRYPGCRVTRDAAEHQAVRLSEQYERARTDGWHWFHDALTYSNAKLPHAMLLAARALQDGRYREIGLEALDFLIDETYDGEQFDFVGNQGWYRRGARKAVLDQQPVEAGYMAEACAEAFLQTGDARYATYARAAVSWFFGRNRLGTPLYHPDTGACYDGLAAAGVNQNQGAESVVACLIGMLAEAGMDAPKAHGHAPRERADSRGEVGSRGASHSSTRIGDANHGTERGNERKR